MVKVSKSCEFCKGYGDILSLEPITSLQADLSGESLI